MPNSDMKILLVDDDPVLTEMHSALLEQNNYSVLVAEDGVRAMRILDSYHENIGVVVSDINMPNMDGYELCGHIKLNDKTKTMPVIFVSGLTSLEEKIKGYSAGADDYIPKPVNDEELCRKIGVLLDIRAKQVSLSKEAAESHSMALQVMTFSSELGQVIEFYKDMMNANNYSDLAKCYFEMIKKFNLVSTLQIHTQQQELNLSDSGIVSPLEVNVLELARDRGRFFDFGARTILNYSTFSMLIKNMPLHDPEKYGRIKDVVNMLGNGLEARIYQLNNEFLVNKRYSSIHSIKDSIRNIEAMFSDLQKDNIAAIEDMNEQVHQAIIELGLTEEQEAGIQQITHACLDRSNRAFYKGLSIENDLENICQQFSHAVDVKT